MKRLTKNDFKRFVKNNYDNLLIKVTYYFNDLDCGISQKDQYEKITKVDYSLNHTFGIDGAWLCNNTRNYFDVIDTDEYTGIKVTNCINTFHLVIEKGV